MTRALNWLVTILVLLVVLFLLQNLATVEVDFLIWELALPKIVLLSLVFLIGGAAGLIIGWRWPRRR